MDLHKEEQKNLFKEVLREWLDDKFADFGRWTLKSMGAALFSAIIYYLGTHGWLK